MSLELNSEDILRQGIAAHEQGKLQDAERLYRLVLKSQPQHPDANHNLGVMAASLNKNDAALPLFKAALEANPKIEQFWLSYIDTLLKTNQVVIAKQVIEQAKKEVGPKEKFSILEAQLSASSRKSVSKSASPSKIQLNALIAHYQNRRFVEAEEMATFITQEFPEYQFGWKVLGIVLKQMGKISEALIATRRSVQLSPQDAEAHCNLGVILQDLKRFEKAEESYKKAIFFKPELAEAHNNLGNTLRELSRLDEAEASYKQAIAVNHELVEAHNNLGNTLREVGRLEDAEASYTRAITLAPAFAEAHSNLGVTLKEMGRLEPAEASFRQAIACKPDYAEACNNLGNTLQEQGRLEDARKSYLRAIALKPDYAEAHSNLGNSLKELGRVDEAVASFQQAFANRTGIFMEAEDALAPGSMELYFELTNKCNFHCVFCPSDSQKRNLGVMDIELAKRLYTEAAETKIASKVNLHLMGEPTLHPKLIEILQYGASKNIKTDLVTNGSTLVEKNVPKILDALYGTLIASHMTPTEDSYKYRGEVGLSWDRYINNLRTLVREYIRRSAKGGIIRSDIKIRVMVTQNTASNVSINETENEARAILKEWNDFVAKVELEEGIAPFKRKDHRAPDLLRGNSQASISYYLQKGVQLSFWRAFTFANSRVGEEFDLEPSEKVAYCPHPFTDVGVLWNGDVTLCCLDHDGELNIGNIQDASIETLIQSEAARELRASMLGQRPLPSLCQNCQAKPVRREERQN